MLMYKTHGQELDYENRTRCNLSILRTVYGLQIDLKLLTEVTGNRGQQKTGWPVELKKFEKMKNLGISLDYFWLSKIYILSQSSRQEIALTKNDCVLGTHPYLPPERHKSKKHGESSLETHKISKFRAGSQESIGITVIHVLAWKYQI